MAYSSYVISSTLIQDKYQCPICCEVLKSPVSISKCKHTFCEECVCRVVSLADRDKELQCPICRISFKSRDLNRNIILDSEICSLTVQCAVCGEQHRLSDWDRHSISHPLPEPHPHAPPPHNQRVHSNRSTFSCPLCPEANLTCLDLVTHVNTSHAHIKAKKVCPVCASMPWGVADQLSQDIVHHLNYRHKFEYDTFVDYDCDEDSTYQAVMAASLNDR